MNQDELTLKRGGMLRGILEAYFENFAIFLPTAGTVLDRGRTLTHRKIVAQLALKGLSTQGFHAGSIIPRKEVFSCKRAVRDSRGYLRMIALRKALKFKHRLSSSYSHTNIH